MRTQIDGLGDEYSLASGTYFDQDEDVCRQEFLSDCDVNNVLSRHGLFASSRALEYGEADYDMDLVSAMQAASLTSQAFSRLDPAVTSVYGSWAAVMAAVARGELSVDGSSISFQHPVAAATSSEGAVDAGSASPEGR